MNICFQEFCMNFLIRRVYFSTSQFLIKIIKLVLLNRHYIYQQNLFIIKLISNYSLNQQFINVLPKIFLQIHILLHQSIKLTPDYQFTINLWYL